MSESNYISIKGAKVNNLKNIDVNIPRNKLVVITGLSGSGKSSVPNTCSDGKAHKKSSSDRRSEELLVYRE